MADQALTLDQAADLMVDLAVHPERSTGRSVSTMPAGGELTLEEAGPLVHDIVSRQEGKVVRLRPKRGKSRGELSLDEAAGVIADIVAEPKGKAAARKGSRAKTDEDVLAAEKRGAMVEGVKLKLQVANAAMEQFLGFLQQIEAEFPNIRRPVDVARLAQTDPVGYAKYQAYQRQVQAGWPQIQAMQIAAEAARQEAFEEFAKEADAKFDEANPNWPYENTVAMLEMLTEGGLPEAAIADLWAGRGGITLTPQAEKIIADATRYRTGKPLEIFHELYAAAVELMKELGFSDEELAALGRGAAVSLRDHRIQQILADATRYRMETKGEPR